MGTGGTTTGKFENENGTVSGTVNVSAVGGPSNSFLPEWADDDDSDTEVGVFDSSGAIVSRSSTNTDTATTTATSTIAVEKKESSGNNDQSKAKPRRQSTLHSGATLAKIEEQNQTAAKEQQNDQNFPRTSSSPSGLFVVLFLNVLFIRQFSQRLKLKF